MMRVARETGWMSVSAHSNKINNFVPKHEGEEEIPPSLKKLFILLF